ncbi:MAG TPA: mechanosensitive ion channel domain-containing protein [Tepidisphaeraceae bacterium]|nr:mechanosensitive ion channel domain-containing protein [Tepidisphaeraceae bacterium]
MITVVCLVAQISPPGPGQPLKLFGVPLIGFTKENLHKLLLTLALIGIVVGLSWLLRGITALLTKAHRSQKVIFWLRQAINLLLTILLVLGIVSIWFNDAGHLATVMGFVTAGVAFALQKPISAFAGYIVILRGKTFNVGDRVVMGGVRGDVIELGFYQTTIMEMGEPPTVQDAPPSVWVEARQYTGRVVTVPNSMVFDGPIFNFTKEFPYIWEEMRLPISYKDDRRKAEQILLDCANRHTVKMQELSQGEVHEMKRRYFLEGGDVEPKVYYRLTDNWVELTVRFICRTHGIRALKDKMSREIIDALDAAKIGIASSTYDVVGMPPIRVQFENGHEAEGQAPNLGLQSANRH